MAIYFLSTALGARYWRRVTKMAVLFILKKASTLHCNYA